ncbi:transcription antitermination factor NusB [Cyclobacterium amurskyense]|uniref:NusB antitermination factor n=1 Tax=Cyclobacterium amurskyense TaxID=320787 RepID=A0A0H4PE95_9BACT|nr:transcription antitermination factor NusB [Cyclobacterium amurskyense]AKP51445.1 NusB antitermination factor [Cyclobacterium amurskyense]
MLNRRILRVKAFQTLYAFHQCKHSNANLAQDFIKEAFLPDLNSMEVQDRSLLKKEAERCIQVFIKNIDKEQLSLDKGDNEKVKDIAVKAIAFYNNNNKKDKEFLRTNMLTAVENIPGLYLFAISMLVGFGEHVRKEKMKKRKFEDQPVVTLPSAYNLGFNKALAIIEQNHSFKKECLRFDVDIAELELEIKEWYRELVKPLEEYQKYLTIENPSLEEDKEILQVIIKKIIFKKEATLSFFQDRDLNWSENKSIVRSLSTKVIKTITGTEDEADEILPELALNWEEDKEFFQDIYNFTIASEKEYSELIANTTKNWDVERIALTDRVILIMALSEMVNFSSIPTKVSINEYIDISKTYSTPKSKQFVNGLLDTLSKELTENGKIRKSGRGLIDNK